MLTGPTSIEGVERTNIVMVHPQQQAKLMPRHNLYIMDMNHERNCYSCGGYGHIMKNCRNQEIVR